MAAAARRLEMHRLRCNMDSLSLHIVFEYNRIPITNANCAAVTTDCVTGVVCRIREGPPIQEETDEEDEERGEWNDWGLPVEWVKLQTIRAFVQDLAEYWDLSMDHILDKLHLDADDPEWAFNSAGYRLPVRSGRIEHDCVAYRQCFPW
jgi:hypothetical protein